MATVAERNAAFDAAEKKLESMIRALAPSFFVNTAESELAAHRADVLQLVDTILEAAEKARLLFVDPRQDQVLSH